MFKTIVLLLALSLVPTFAAAQDAVKVTRVAFRDGRASLRGGITGYETHDYVFPVGAGEPISLRLKSSNGSNYFNLTPPGAQEALFIGSTSGDRYSGVAPVSGDYTARVYLMRSDARRRAKTNFVLTIALGMKSPAQANGPDFADGLSGGPDYWEVTGVPAGDKLNVRAAPSPRAAPVTQVMNSAILKNLGGRNIQGRLWRQVEDAAGRRGWVNGKYLREAASPPQ